MAHCVKKGKFSQNNGHFIVIAGIDEDDVKKYKK